MEVTVNENRLKKNEKYVEVQGTKPYRGKLLPTTITRIGKLVHVNRYSKSAYKYKVRIAPGIFIWLKKW